MTPVHTKARRDGLYLLLLGSVVFILFGGALSYISPVSMIDFGALYHSARCLVQNGDPYNSSDVLRVYRADGADRPSQTKMDHEVATRYLYPPTSFALTVPFALLPWGAARLLWLMLTTGSLIFASLLTWDLSVKYAPLLSGLLIGFLLANSELLVIVGNPAGIAISLCVLAVWCFVRERFVPVGILCLAVSIALKPHDTGLVWLYFLLAGGVYRKRAWQALLAMVVFTLPVVIWVWHVAPNWIWELRASMAAFSGPGGLNEPGLNSTGAHGIGMLVSLQAVFAAFWDDPRLYNPASYLTFAPLFLAWVFVTLKSPRSTAKTWIAIAAIAALSMLPVYHRQQDTKLLLLTVPACAMLWCEGGLTAWLALLVNSAGFVLAGDIPWAIFFGLINKLHPPMAGLGGKILIGMQILPVPLILLIMGIFYLWVYMRRSDAQASPNAP